MITPLAQRLAEENNVDWEKLEGTGKDGKIMERDVLQYIAELMNKPPRVVNLDEVA